MLTRFIRIQLLIFAIASVVGMVTMAVVYIQAPTLLGLGRIVVRLELPAGGGIYRMSNVTYRGIEVGKVTDVKLTPVGAEVTMSLASSPRIPADLVAEVRSVSAVGEQYVDLRPRSSAPPYLETGSVITRRDARIPQPVGPMLDNVSALLGSIPKDKLSAVLDESSKALDGAGFDIGSLVDSSATVARDFHSVSGQAQALIDDSGPLLDGQVQSADATRTWARSLAGVTDSLVAGDPHIRTVLQQGPGALQEVSRLLNSVKPTLPVLLANLTSLGQVGVTYLPSLEQLLVLIPPYFADLQAIAPNNNATGLPLANFRIEMSDPPACTVGYLPPSQWRSPTDTTTMDTPDGLYCKLPQDSPILVRGARNLPCMGKPGKRAPTVDICESDKPYMPLAMRQHALGPGPVDPNLLAQGIPPDDRVTNDDHIQAPLDGTPLPPGVDPSAPGPAAPPPAPEPLPDTSPQPDAPAAPSAYSDSSPGPSVAVATYDPRTGRFMASDGSTHVQSNLVARPSAEKSQDKWKDLILDPSVGVS